MSKKAHFSGIGVIGGSRAFLTIEKDWGSCVSRKKVKTPFGMSAPLYMYEKEGIGFAFISRHGEKGYDISAPFVNYRANIWAMKKAGIERIISWSGPGIINKSKFKVADIVLPSDVIDETRMRKNTFFENTGIGFVRQNPVFCPELADFLEKTGREMKVKIKKGGVYVCTEGPRLETVAEIKKYAGFGADLVGMTIVLECFVAREIDICYHPVCYLTNLAEGVRKDADFKPGVLFEGMQSAEEAKKVKQSLDLLPALIFGMVKKFHSKARRCICPDNMLRYRKSGKLSKNWNKWFK